jgi:hypothetical protein
MLSLNARLASGSEAMRMQACQCSSKCATAGVLESSTPVDAEKKAKQGHSPSKDKLKLCLMSKGPILQNSQLCATWNSQTFYNAKFPIINPRGRILSDTRRTPTFSSEA